MTEPEKTRLCICGRERGLDGRCEEERRILAMALDILEDLQCDHGANPP
jgi:hypothetical protein